MWCTDFMFLPSPLHRIPEFGHYGGLFSSHPPHWVSGFGHLGTFLTLINESWSQLSKVTEQAIGTGGIVPILTDWFMFHSYTQYRLFKQLALFTYWPTDSCSTATHSTGYSNSWHCSHTDWLIHVPQLHTVQAIQTVGIVHILTDWFMFHSYTKYRLIEQVALFTY